MNSPASDQAPDELKYLHLGVALGASLAATLSIWVGAAIGVVLACLAYRRLGRRLTRHELMWLAIIAVIAACSAVATVQVATHWESVKHGLAEAFGALRGR